MAYVINKSDGTVLTTIGDGFLDTSTALNLPGPNYVGYGEKLNENLVHILENFAGPNAPLSTAMLGQLWFDSSHSTLNVFTGQGYVPVSGTFTSGIPPAYPKEGDIWYNSTTGQTKLYFDGDWQLIGPEYTKAQGKSGALPQVIADASSDQINHTVVTLTYGSQTMAIISADDTFTPSPPIFGFPTISPGITFANTIQNAGLRGTITGNVVSQNNNVVVVNNLGPTTVFTGNLVGAVTGPVTGNLTGNVTGNLTGTTVAATTLTASGNITAANVVAPGLYGTLAASFGNQSNITTVGTLTGLTVGNVSVPASVSIIGTATLNGVGIATLGGSASFSSINGTPVGNLTPSTGAFSTLTAGGLQAVAIGNVLPGSGRFTTITTGTINAPYIGNTGSVLTGTIGTASQPNITGVGAISSGTWQGTVIAPTYGGTGINNGVNTLTIVGGARTLDQNVNAGAAPSFVGTNFTNIPASAVIGGGTAGVGTLAATGTVSGLTLTAAGSGAGPYTGAVTVTLGGSLSLTSSQITSALGFTPYNSTNPNNYLTSSALTYNAIVNALGYTPYNNTNPNGYVGTSALSGYLSASGTLTGSVNTSSTCYTGALISSSYIRADGDITAYYSSSDRRLKENIVPIEGALGKVLTLTGYHYNYKHRARSNLVGVMADEVKKVLPEAVYDHTPTGVEANESDPYLAVRYDLLVPLLLESIKELNAKVEALEARLAK